MAESSTQLHGITLSLITIEVLDNKESDFAKHVDECNTDFKENIVKKIVTLKLKDTEELNAKVCTLN